MRGIYFFLFIKKDFLDLKKNCLTPGGDEVVVLDPPSGLTTNLTDLFSVRTGCIHPNCSPCVNPSTQCGNSCEIPHSATW